MQITSKAYKTEQKKYLRNEQYVNVYLGVISREAQANSEPTGDFALYSSGDLVTGNPTFEAYYATCEDNQAKVDGTMFFMPRSRVFALYQGLVTEKMADSVTFTFGQYSHLNIRGLTIDFGDYYPTHFIISNGTARCTYEYTNDHRGVWTTDDQFLDSSMIRITPLEMVGGNQRLRILSILFGIGLIFDNSNLISTSWVSEVAHLSDTLPAKSFSFTVDNLSRMFSADNPKAYTMFLEEQQEVRFEYRRMLDDGSIYTIPGGKMSLKSWSSNDVQAKFKAVGQLDYSSGIYNYGRFYPDGISLYDLAEDICTRAGYPSYNIDPYLKHIITHNPLPLESYKNCLQLIANAAQAIIYESRDGSITIEASFEPDITSISSPDKTIYSTLDKLVTDDPAVQFADVENDYVYTDGHQYFLPRTGTWLDTGYVSQKMSNDEGVFYKASDNYRKFVHSGGTVQGFNFESTKYGKFVSGNYKVDFNEDSTDNPTLTVEWETTWTFYDLQLEFKDVCPKSLVIHSYDGETEKEIVALDDLDYSTPIQHEFYEIDRLVFEFVETNPYQRIHLEKIIFGNSVGYTLDYRDMTASPVATRAEFVSKVDVIYTRFSYGTEEKLVSTVGDVQVAPTQSEVFFDVPYHSYRLEYTPIPDDDETHTKIEKKFVSSLPPAESANVSTLYIVGTYNIYTVQTDNNVKSWQFVGSKSGTNVNTLPSSLNNNYIYFVATDNQYIKHMYMNYTVDGTTSVVSLGYYVNTTPTITNGDCAYYMTFTSPVATPVDIYAIPFNIGEKTYSIRINDVGVDKTVRNVLIDNLDHAIKESEWVEDYYSNDIEYDIQYRGEPSLEPDDMIYIENKFVEKNKVRITTSQIDTATGMSMSCSLTGRRISYE